MKIPPNLWHIVCVIVAASAVIFAALAAQPQFQAVAWIGAVATVLSVLKSVFTDTPAVTAAKAKARSRGAMTVSLPVDPPAETKVSS